MVIPLGLKGVPLTQREQLLKAINKQPGLSEAQIDSEAVLLRAYGKDTEVLIDRKSRLPSRKHPSLADMAARGNIVALSTRPSRPCTGPSRTLR